MLSWVLYATQGEAKKQKTSAMSVLAYSIVETWNPLMWNKRKSQHPLFHGNLHTP